MRKIEQYMNKFMTNINPSKSYVDTAISEHETLRSKLEKSEVLSGYKPITFLQGSYKKNTAIETIKDVDIVCLFTKGYEYPKPGEPILNPFTANRVYNELYSALAQIPMYKDKLRHQRRSVGIMLTVQLDVIPAIAGPQGADANPIRIPEKNPDGTMKWIDTYTRVDINACSEKNANSYYNFVPVVKIMKYWRNVRLADSQTPKSIFLETLLHHVPNSKFEGSLAPAYVNVCKWIVNNVTPDIARTKSFPMVGSKKDVFSGEGWSISDYSYFHNKLSADLRILEEGLNKDTDGKAAGAWKSIFGQRFPSNV